MNGRRAIDQVRGSVVDGQELNGEMAKLVRTLDLREDRQTGERRVEAFVIDRSGRIARTSAKLKQ